MNIFYLIGHGGSGKSLYAKSIATYCKVEEMNTVYYDEDEQVAKVAGYASFSDLVENESFIQHFYNQYLENLKIEAEKNKDTMFVIATGGFSLLIDETLYKNGYKIYIKSSLLDILKSVEERKKIGIHFPIIQGFEITPKKLNFKEFELKLFESYYYKANNFFTKEMDFLIENRHQDKELFDLNIKKILEYINITIKSGSYKG